MLYTLLAADMPAANKKKVIHDEYSIPMEKAVDEEVEYMCNLSSLYINRGEKRGIEKGRAEGRVEGRAEEKIEVAFELYKQNIPIEVIATATKLSIDEINKLIKSFGS